eukprot:9495111-Pyramimonas_sp.AAC.1
MEEAEGISRLDDCMRVYRGSTPWAKLVQDDLKLLALLSEDFCEWYPDDGRDWLLFVEGAMQNEKWRSTGVLLVRSHSRRLRRMRKEGLSKMDDNNLDDMDTNFICNMGIMKEGVEVERGKAYTSYRALAAHQQQTHRCISVLGLLTRTNQCPWCRTIFASRQVAVDHVMAATEGKKKKLLRNLWKMGTRADYTRQLELLPLRLCGSRPRG